MTESFAKPTMVKHSKLSNREFDVMLLLAQGITSSEISYRFKISIKTVSNYRARVLFKLELNNNAEITRYCNKNKLID